MESASSTQKERLFSGRQLVALLIPLVIEQTLTLTIGLADTLMVSSMGEAAVSGVSLVDSINTLMIQILAALATGGAVVASQYIGRGDRGSAQKCSAQIIVVMLAFSGVIMLFAATLRRGILSLVFGSIESDVMTAAEIYFLLSALSYPFLAVYNAATALFRAQGNSNVSMFSSLIMNVVNIGGNALLIFYFHMGVTGAALASLIARALACFVVLMLLQHHMNPLRIEHLSDLLPDFPLIRRILSIGIPSAIENGMFQFGKLSVSHLTSTLGTAAIAANAVAGNISSILNVPASAVGLAAVAVVGQCIGAGEKKQARWYSIRLLILAWIGCIAANVCCLFFGTPVMQLFHLSPEALSQCLLVTHWFNIVSILCWPLSFTLTNFLRAAGDAKYTMWVSVISMWTCRVISSYVLVLVFGLGLLGVWLGMFLDWVIRSVFFVGRFAGGKWLDKKVI